MRYWIMAIVLCVAACDSDEAVHSDQENDDDGAVQGEDEDTSSAAEREGTSATSFDGDETENTDSDGEENGEQDTGSGLICPEGRVLYTTADGMSYCCGGTFPVFCDSNDDGYIGGCWGAGTDCETIIFCDDRWSACPSGTVSSCQGDGVHCSAAL